MPFTRGVVELAGDPGTVEVTVGVPVTGWVWFRLTSSTVIRFSPELLLA